MNKRIIQTAKRLFAASMIFMLGMTPNALAEEVETTYYITSRGVELTETQYNNLISVFTENSINTMTQEQINIYKNDGDLINEQVVLKLDENNNCINPGLISRNILSDEILTEYKRLTMNFVSQPAKSHKTVSVKCEWLKLPKYRSYDVIAIRVTDANAVFGFDENLVSGSQKWDGNIVNYDSSSGKDHFKFTSKGVGLSMNLSDDAEKTIECELIVTFGSTADPFIAAGSYQHATSNVTLTQSKWYDIMASGYGYVIDFYDIIQDKYDNTPGLLIAHSFKELEGE